MDTFFETARVCEMVCARDEHRRRHEGEMVEGFALHCWINFLDSIRFSSSILVSTLVLQLCLRSTRALHYQGVGILLGIV